MIESRIRRTLAEHTAVISGVGDLEAEIKYLSHRMVEALRAGHRIYWMGNGGSAADCQHLAAELVGRFARERPGLASVALTTDTSVLTSVGNDYGFSNVFARQIEALCQPGDILIGLSTSGNSENVVRGMERAEGMDVLRVGLSGGTGGRLKACTELCLVVPSSVTARIQEAHIVLGHILCDLVEEQVTLVTGP